MARKTAAQPQEDTLGSLCDMLTTLGNNKATVNAKVKEIEAEENAIELKLIALMKTQGTDIARGATMTASLGKKKLFTVDWPKFYQFQIRKKRPDLLQKRLHQAAVQELLDQGIKIPGVLVGEEDKLSLRRREQGE